MQPHQVISLEDLPGEVSFADASTTTTTSTSATTRSTAATRSKRSSRALLKPDQWQRLIDRLGQIENPKVPIKPSKYSLPDEEPNGRSGRAAAKPLGED